MEPAAAGLARPVVYGVNATSRALLPVGLLGLAAGLFLLWGRPGGRELAAGIAGTGAGAAILAWAAWRRLRPAAPLLELSPAGLSMRIPGATRFTAPWREVRAVATLDVTIADIPARRGATAARFPCVTAVAVTRDFYDRVIHVDSALLRGPGWDGVFIDDGAFVQIALHHELLRVPADELRRAVEARWRAFGGAGAAAGAPTAQAGATAGPARAVTVSYGGGWPQLAILVVFGLAGLMAWFGVWPFDATARREREYAAREREWAERDRRAEDMRRELESLSRQVDADRRARDAAAEAERRRDAERRAEDAARERAEREAGGPLPAPAPTKIDGHAGAVTALAVAPNQHSFVSAGADGAVKLWDKREAAALRDVRPAGASPAAIALAPDGASLFAGGADGRIVRRALPDGEELQTFDAAGEGAVRALRVTGERLVSLHAGGVLILRDLPAGTRRAGPAGDPGRTSFALSADGPRLVTGGEDGAVLLRALGDGAELRRFAGHDGPVLAVALDATGARLVSAGADGTARLWDVATGAELLRVASLQGAFRAAAFLAGGQFATGSDDGAIRLWDTRGVERMRYFPAPPRPR